MILTRRQFFSGAVALLAAPAIVRASSIMSVVPVETPEITGNRVWWVRSEEDHNLYWSERHVGNIEDPLPTIRKALEVAGKDDKIYVMAGHTEPAGPALLLSTKVGGWGVDTWPEGFRPFP